MQLCVSSEKWNGRGEIQEQGDSIENRAATGTPHKNMKQAHQDAAMMSRHIFACVSTNYRPTNLIPITGLPKNPSENKKICGKPPF